MSNNTENKIKLIWCNDWEVLIINGEKVFSSHPMDSQCLLSILKSKLGLDVEVIEVDEDEMYKYE